MYQQPLQHQQTWSSAQFAQVPKPPTLSTWPSAPVIHTAQNGHAAAGPHPAPHHSFVPPAPPGVNPQQWQNGRWMYTAPPGGVSNAQPQGPYPPPNLVGWNVPAGWGIAPQYYHPPQRQAEPSYWDTKLTDNGLGLENMHIKYASSSIVRDRSASLIRSVNRQPAAHPAPGGKDKTPHTPWAWVPRELDDESPPPSTSSTQYRSAFQSQQPSPVEPSGRQNSTTASAAPPGGSTGYPGPGQASHAYFSIPVDQQQQQHQPANTGSGSRPILPPATTYSAHIRQRSNPQQTATATHHQPAAAAAAAGSQSTTSTLPSQPPAAQALQRSHGIAAPTPQRPGRTESYTSVKQLRPTFSPAIVRTPNHYRHDSQPVVPSPRVAGWDDVNPNTNSVGISTSANKHLSGAMQSMVPSPRVLPWNGHARENDGGSPTPAPRHLRSSRMYETPTRQTVQRSYSIPEPPRQPIPVSRQNSMPTVQTGHHDHHHGLSSIGDLPQFAEEPDSVMSLSPLIGTEPSESSESSASTTVRAESPQPLFIPPRHSRSPSPSPRHRRSRAVSPSSSSSSSSSSSDSEDSDSGRGGPHHRRRQHHSSRRYRSPSHLHSQHRISGGHQSNNSSHYGSGGGGATYTGTPQGRSPASSTHTYRSSSSSNPLPTPPQERRDPGFSLPPPQQAKPPGGYRHAVRYGFWNRRGDYLTMDKYVVYAPHNRANPPELEGYPAPTEGYKDHYGNFVKYDPSRTELPESLPRQGLPPVLPYEKVGSSPLPLFLIKKNSDGMIVQFVTYVYR
jgi:hypothetical protein